MKVLITGASGFVGRATCTWLVTQGLEVVGTVRHSHTPVQPVAGVSYRIVGDLNADTDWRATLAGVQGIIHCAARVHVMRETAEDPLAAFRSANVAGTERLARQAAAAGVKRLVFISSIKVNGEETASSSPLPQGERVSFREDDTPAPQDPYGQTKWEAEVKLAQVAQETGLEVVIVRPPLVYGPGVKGNLARLLSWVERGVPLPLAGIRNARSLIGIDNFTSALHACLTHPAAAGRTYLVRDGEDISTSELVRRLGRHLGRPARLFALPTPLLESLGGLTGRRTDVQRLTGSLTVDDSRIRHELGWMPPYSLDEGLGQMARAWLDNA
ncbi:UDP-glucose 4-epimerase [Sulfuriferula multivorans]|uniref:UDP-glucose 4-epimerase n=1 Tax=Sulfuriferula multivorans TaxID=1559896 RepID=A0A401J9G4_9PROT|nr:SDR family oxidoreductase [Sulfuriferula multivorans]GBL44267.1 UDP-glucose 4-epimerase [Sulfuriferula multivorans]